MLRRGTAVVCAVWVVFAAGLSRVEAQNAVSKEPRITAVSPLALTGGGKTTLRILGVNLAAARQLVFPGTGLPPVGIPERKASELPKGLEMKDAGETQFEVTVDIPVGLPGGCLPLAVQCESARSASVALPVREAAAQTAEREPNNGFQEANPLREGLPVLGGIQSEKDTDVFVFHPAPGQRYEVAITAGARASLLDAALAVYDPDFRLVVSADDTSGSDASLAFVVKREGAHYVAVTDAADKGGWGCVYELILRKIP
jgi:hypothetical protein